MTAPLPDVVHNGVTEAPAEPDTTSGPVSPAPDTDAGHDAADSESGEIVIPPCPRVPLDLLAPNPGNVRGDLDLNEEFIASIRADGVRDPIEVVPLPPAPDGAGEVPGSPGNDSVQHENKPRPQYMIVDGHRRYFGALEAGVKAARVFLSADCDGGEASHYLAMFTTSRHDKHLTPAEEAGALFAAHEAGATATLIRRKTGLSREDVKTAIKAGGLNGDTRSKAAEAGYDLTIDQLALIAEFEDDARAVGEILYDINTGGSGQHAAGRVRQRQAAKAAADAAREQFAAGGYQVADELPEGALFLSMLLHDGEDVTPEGHARCPGRGVVVTDDDPEGRDFCAAPYAHGHVYRYAPGAPGSAAGGDSDPVPEPDGPSRRLVVEGNRAWVAAGKVRLEFLRALCGRATVARDAGVFAARQLLEMPAAVAAKLSSARHEGLFRDLTGGVTAGHLDAWKPGKLPLIPLALVATCYEVLLTSDAGKATWRETSERRNPPVHRDDAGAYFTALAALGYELSTIEQAVADGVPYAGEPGLTPHPAAAGGTAGDDPAPQDNAA